MLLFTQFVFQIIKLSEWQVVLSCFFFLLKTYVYYLIIK
ncbi:MAG: hypothetical protein RL078_1531 [Bacteroidota bacterium]